MKNILHCFRSLAVVSFMLAVMLPAPTALSLPLAPSGLPANWLFTIGGIPSTAGFYPSSRTYFSTAQGTGGIFSASGPFMTLANDVVSTTLLSAKVSPTGVLESGTFAVIGSSESLGIATGTTLLSATITDVYWNPADSPNLFQFRARVDFVSPALREAAGPVKSLLIYDFVAIDDDFANNPWNSSFFGTGPTTSPTVYMSPFALPLTPAELRGSFVTVGTSAAISSYDDTTNVYSIAGEIGSAATPSFVLGYPGGFSDPIATDAIGSFDLNAIIDENGVVNSGTASWTGGIASLGIPAGNTLIEGQVSEAFFRVDDFSVLFEFLVTVDTVHPLLEAAVGEVETLLIYDFQSPSLDFIDNPWNASFSDGAWTTGPDIYGSPESMMNSDTDGDGIADSVDNCTTVSNARQRDTNSDGFGNSCDPDLNNDGIVNFADVVLWVPFFNTATTGDADFDGDGVASFGDYAIFPEYFLKPPGPSEVSLSALAIQDAQETGK